MTVYKILFDEAFRITGSLDQSAAIVSAAINDGVHIALESRDPKKAQLYMINRVVNRSNDYVRLRDHEDFSNAANELNEPIGMIRQIMRSIKEGNFIN